MNQSRLACRLGTSAPAPGWALSPKPYTMCKPTRMRFHTRIHTRTLTRVHKPTDSFTICHMSNCPPPLTSLYLLHCCCHHHAVTCVCVTMFIPYCYLCVRQCPHIQQYRFSHTHTQLMHIPFWSIWHIIAQWIDEKQILKSLEKIQLYLTTDRQSE